MDPLPYIIFTIFRVLLHLLANTTYPMGGPDTARSKRSEGGETFGHPEGPPLPPRPRSIEIAAQFSVDGQTDSSLAFLDDQRVLIAHFDDCAAARNFQNEVNWIALATIVVVALLGCSSLVGLCLYRQHRRANEDQLDLVDHMSPQPYNLTTPEQR